MRRCIFIHFMPPLHIRNWMQRWHKVNDTPSHPLVSCEGALCCIKVFLSFRTGG